MIRQHRAAAAVAAAAAWLGGAAAAQPTDPDTMAQPSVQVVFGIEAYADEYSGAKKAELDAWVTAELIGLLRRFAYLTFTEQPAPHRLAVALVERNREVFFSITVEDTATHAKTEPLKWQLRDPDHFTVDVTDIASFREEIRQSLVRLIDERADTFTASCLSEVPICSGGRHLASVFIALPFRCHDFKLDERTSQFRVQAKVRWQGVPVTDQDTFDAQGQGVVEDATGELADWVGRTQARIFRRRSPGELLPHPGAQVESITITGVSVLVYRKSDVCLKPVSPDELDLQ